MVKKIGVSFDALEDEAIRCNFRGVPGWDLRCTSRGIRVLCKEQKYVEFRRAA